MTLTRFLRNDNAEKKKKKMEKQIFPNYNGNWKLQKNPNSFQIGNTFRTNV